jgi:hypothetical protein
MQTVYEKIQLVKGDITSQSLTSQKSLFLAYLRAKSIENG